MSPAHEQLSQGPYLESNLPLIFAFPTLSEARLQGCPDILILACMVQFLHLDSRGCVMLHASVHGRFPTLTTFPNAHQAEMQSKVSLLKRAYMVLVPDFTISFANTCPEFRLKPSVGMRQIRTVCQKACPSQTRGLAVLHFRRRQGRRGPCVTSA